MPTTTHILGIRHHGPGSARSVLRVLEEVRPTAVLVEGPPDADEVIAFAGHAALVPPVAILVHQADAPTNAVYYPFAEFSPEWQALRWSVTNGVAVRFMDLPMAHRMALERSVVEPPDDDDEAAPALSPEPDPLNALAQAAGFDDGERWWEHVVEHQAAGDLAMFAAIRDAMAELRGGKPRDADEPLREAWMRRTLRQTIKEGHERIVVICGAWHAPALDVDAVTKKSDDDLLKGLAKVKTAATWVPWTHDRLTFASGYGAGVQSPGWYEHLWQRTEQRVESWMTRVARLLRAKDIDCSSAHVIEAVRLSTTLASLRGRPLADLSDIADATRSIFCFDSDAALRLIGSELLVGHKLGELPDDIPMIPLQQDLIRLQKSLRLKPTSTDKVQELDLRKDLDRGRSHLLHRLRLLGIDWGMPEAASGKGTFKEHWRLRWEPEFAVKLIEAGVLGTTIESAAAGKLRQLATESDDLRQLSDYLQDALLAELGGASVALVQRIEAVAAVAADVTLLMQTLPNMAALLRYGNVRQTDATLVREIVDGIVPRINAGLGGAVASANDEAAEELEVHLRRTDDAIGLLDDEAHAHDWYETLDRILASESVHGLLRGRCARLLLDHGRLEADDVARHLGRTLSRGNDPAAGARWLEGFLSGSGLLLIHDDKLLGLIDDWVAHIAGDVFDELIPLLRRTFSSFPAAERRQIGAMVKASATITQPAATRSADLNHERAARALPLLKIILGGRS